MDALRSTSFGPTADRESWWHRRVRSRMSSGRRAVSSARSKPEMADATENQPDTADATVEEPDLSDASLAENDTAAALEAVLAVDADTDAADIGRAAGRRSVCRYC